MNLIAHFHVQFVSCMVGQQIDWYLLHMLMCLNRLRLKESSNWCSELVVLRKKNDVLKKLV